MQISFPSGELDTSHTEETNVDPGEGCPFEHNDYDDGEGCLSKALHELQTCPSL